MYSPEDDKLIVEQVRLNGDVHKTHAKIAKVLGIKDPKHIAARYINHLSSQKIVKGKYSPDEDNIILDYVNQHGKVDKKTG